MELENLRDSWRSANEAGAPLHGRSEADLQRMAARVAAGKAQSSIQRLRRRWRMAILLVILLPVIWNTPLQGGDPLLRRTGCIVLCLFVASALTHILYFLRLLDRCDPAHGFTVRETAQAAVRLRRRFLQGEVLHILLAVGVLTLLCLHQQTMPYGEYWYYGFGVGLAIGVPIGIHKFLRMLRDIDLLADALKELDE